MEYLALPLVLRDGHLARTDLNDSIAHSVGLILSTRVGTMSFSPDYGCDLWEKEFSDLYTANKADIRASLRNALARFEKRLYNVTVSVAAGDSKWSHALGMTVKVTGNYQEGDEERKFEAHFNLG